MLTTKTEKAWETSLPWVELSQTIKDSVHVCIKLGFKDLWVDALCIVQDNTTDKVREIAAMAPIYEAATLTLAASVAAAATEGFLQARKFTHFSKQVFGLPVRCPDGQLGTVILFRPPPSTHLSAEPLDSRGWTLQERHLSSRLLEFKKFQLKWTCWTVLLKEEDNYFDGWYDNDEAAVARINVHDDALSIWMKMVYGYTLRNLTVASDRILAFSGAADALGRSIRGKYCAGLWESNLPLCLMWRSTPTNAISSASKSAILIPRPTKYQGPSWSWVSVNTIAHYRVHPNNKFSIHVEVLGCDIKLADERAMYGAVKSARLHIRGRIRLGILHYFPGNIDWHKSRCNLDTNLAKGSAYASVDALEPEFASPTSSPIRVHLIEVMRLVRMVKDEVGDAISEGLILRQLPSQQYSRLGTFAFYTSVTSALSPPQNIWFDEYDKEILCLI